MITFHPVSHFKLTSQGHPVMAFLSALARYRKLQIAPCTLRPRSNERPTSMHPWRRLEVSRLKFGWKLSMSTLGTHVFCSHTQLLYSYIFCSSSKRVLDEVSFWWHIMVQELEVHELEEQAAAACKEWCRSREAVSVARTAICGKSRQQADNNQTKTNSRNLRILTFEALRKQISRVFKTLI